MQALAEKAVEGIATASNGRVKVSCCCNLGGLATALAAAAGLG